MSRRSELLCRIGRPSFIANHGREAPWEGAAATPDATYATNPIQLDITGPVP